MRPRNPTAPSFNADLILASAYKRRRRCTQSTLGSMWFNSAAVIVTCLAIISVNKLPAESRPTATSRKSSLSSIAKPRLNSDRFIVLSTGTQLKLYPISEQDEASATNYFVLKPTTVEEELTSESNQEDLSSSPIRSKTDEEDDDPKKSQLIEKLDAFIDSRFCPASAEGSCDCLVVVWFDERDRSVHYGSVDLGSSILQNQQDGSKALSSKLELARHVDKILYLIEYSDPIQICETGQKCKLESMSVDKIRLRLNLVVSHPFGQMLLVHSLHTYNKGVSDHMKKYELDELAIRSNGLIVDELAGDIFYSLVNDSQIQMMHARDGVKLVLASKRKDLTISQQTSAHSKISAITWDTQTQRFVWICDTSNEIYSSDIVGNNVTKIGEMNSKPVVRSVDRVRIMESTLYLSDPIKKSILAFRLSDAKSSRRASVVLVEMPTIFDFKPIDLRQANQVTSLMCFDHHETHYCTRAMQRENELSSASASTTCDASVKEWKQAVLQRQINTFDSQKQAQVSRQQQSLVRRVEKEDIDISIVVQTFDLDVDKKEIDLLRQANETKSSYRIPIEYICLGTIVVAIVLIIYVTRLILCNIKPEQQSPHQKRHQLIPDSLRSFVLRPKQKIDKRPLVATIDCSSSAPISTTSSILCN